jgi:hypothetical protein
MCTSREEKLKRKKKISLLSKYALPEYYLHNQNEFIYFINLSRDEVIEHKRMYYPIMIFYKLRNISISFQITNEILRIIILLQTAPGTFQKKFGQFIEWYFSTDKWQNICKTFTTLFQARHQLKATIWHLIFTFHNFDK